MEDDIELYLEKFIRCKTSSLDNHGSSSRDEMLTKWNDEVDNFCFFVQSNMISGQRYRRFTRPQHDGELNDNFLAKDSENIHEPQLNTVMAMEEMLAEVGIFNNIDRNHIDIDQSCIPNRIITSSLRNVYRLVLLLNSNSPTEAAKITSKIKGRHVLEYLLKIISGKDQLCATQASMALFQALRHDQDTKNLFLKRICGLPVLIRKLLTESSIALKVSLVKHLHQFLGEISQNMISTLNLINDIIADEIEKDIKAYGSMDLVHVLVAQLCWCLRSSNFPGQINDQRCDLVEEIMHILLVVQPTYSGDLCRFVKRAPSVNAKKEVLTQLGILICEILHLTNQDSRSYRCKLSTVMLLIEMPSDFSDFLLINGGVNELFVILDLQLNEVVIERIPNSSVAIIPILIVLNQLIESNKEVKSFASDRIFPKSSEQISEDRQNNEAVDDKNVRMRPEDAPYGSLRWKIIQLMTWNDSNVKRCASELLWNVCENSSEFVKRTGYGNAIHMLGIKGLVKLPTGE